MMVLRNPSSLNPGPRVKKRFSCGGRAAPGAWRTLGADLSSAQDTRTMSHAKAGFLSPSNAAYIAKCARKLLRSGELTHHQVTILEAMLWDARRPGSDRVVVSYAGLQKLARTCRQTIADAIAAFERLGLVRRIKHKVLVLWTNGGRKWQQRPNEYEFCCESGEQTEYPKEVIQILISEPQGREVRVAQEGLVAIAASRARALGLG
jgi:hypothetical protein